MMLYVMPQGLCLSRAINNKQPLSPQGREQVNKAALVFKRLLLGFDYLLSGPTPGSLETAAIIAATLGYPEQAVSCADALRPGAPMANLITTLEGIDPKAGVFLVGAQTALEHFLEAVMHWGVKGSLVMQPAGLTCVEIMSFDPLRGQLWWHFNPRQIQLIAGA